MLENGDPNIDVDELGRRVLQQPAGWSGTMAFQALLFDGSGAPVGTSTYVVTE